MNFLKNIFSNKVLLTYIAKFLVIFCLFYYGTKLIIGLSYKEGKYSSFIHHYFDYVSWIKITLMHGAKIIAKLFGYTTIYEPNFLIRVVNKRGVIISQGCVGYGIMSFWSAFILSNKSEILKKIMWLVSGLILIWVINVVRIGLFLVSINKGWKMPLGIDHHTWFNIFAYTGVFTLIYFYEKSLQANEG